MKNKFTKVLLLSIILLFAVSEPVLALQTNPVGSQTVKVSATVGAYYLNLFGYIAPFASISLTSDTVVLATTTADAKGYFTFKQLLVKKGFSHFCFTAVDVKRLGESDSCFTIPAVTKDSQINNIFLPPTIGLFRTTINVGSNAIVWGYSMPGAKVQIHLSDGSVFTITADASGYYEIHPVITKVGRYELFADASYQNTKSQEPINRAILTAIGLTQQVGNTISNWLRNLLTFLFNLPFLLFLLIPLIALIIYLWRKLHSAGVPQLGPQVEKGTFFDQLFRKRKLHHAWFVGY